MTSQKRSQKVLIVEDDHGLLKVLSSDFKDRGFEVCAVNEIGSIPEDKFDYAVIILRSQLTLNRSYRLWKMMLKLM